VTKIFISYRHDDAPTAVAWLTHTLSEQYGTENVFEYKDHAQPARDFRQVIGRAIRKCDVMLAILGKHWKLGRDEATTGIKSIDDWVRIELETAMQLALPVLPVLVEGATMPAAGELPETLRNFSFLTAVTIDTSNKNFHRDVQALVVQIDKLAQEGAASTSPGTQPPIRPIIGAPFPRAAEMPGTSYQGLAIASLVCALSGIIPWLGIVTGSAAIVLGIIARNKMEAAKNLQGYGLALAGIIIGAIAIVWNIIVLLVAAFK
jgi:hypothetical protein